MSIVSVLALMFAVIFGGLVLLEILSIGNSGAAISGLVGTFFRTVQAISMVWYIGFFVALVGGALGLLFAANRR